MRRLTCEDIGDRKIRWAMSHGPGLWPDGLLHLYNSIYEHHRQPKHTEASLSLCRQLFRLENTV